MTGVRLLGQANQAASAGAQLLVSPVLRVEWDETTELPATDRGAGGFGHTGH